MTKIRTLEELQQVLDDDLVWRKKELSIVVSYVTRSSSKEIIDYHIRGGIALLYAHWEGFIKTAGVAYLTYVASQRLTYSELNNNFIALATKKLLNEASQTNKATVYTQVVEFLTSRLNERCILIPEIETKSNLSSNILKEITCILGLDYSIYVTKEFLIDETLLNSRNNIAHGSHMLMDVSTYITLQKTIVELMNLFSNQVSNAASTKSFKRAAVVSP